MSIINLLDKQTANLIAAGEVVDRPASVAKELLENSIDAGADSITVEIKNGGSTMIRITDNGKGMTPEDVRLSVLRHATSKISTAEDLNGIKTLGFRGEALAAISSVSRFQIISKTPDADFGVCMNMEAEKEISFEEVGCPDGTTITVRDIFFNVPARRKFLKKDQTETAYISQYIERIAISNPQIAIKFIVDSKTRFSTPGNSDLKATIYAVFGKEFSESLMKVENEVDGIKVYGFISEPDKARVNRNFQMLYVNGRFVRSRLVFYAIEDAYKTYIFNERFPACVLFIDINPYLVDVNVHPSKLEIRFVDEAEVRRAVYFTVRDALESIVNPISLDISETAKDEEKEKQLLFFAPEKIDMKKEQVSFTPSFTSSKKTSLPHDINKDFSFLDELKAAIPKTQKPDTFDTGKIVFSDSGKASSEEDVFVAPKTLREAVLKETEPVTQVKAENSKLDLKYCGNVFHTYIIAEYEDNMYIVDKHAAHERILYESLKTKKETTNTQMLIDTVSVSLSPEEFDTAFTNEDDISKIGFDFSEFGPNTIAIRGIPTEFSGLDTRSIENVFVGILSDIIKGRRAEESRDSYFDRALFTAACKAAVKGGIADSVEAYTSLLHQLSELENVFCCPHGRPIVVKYTKTQIEKMFFRT